MGMYDELYCEVEVPDREVPADTCFRTLTTGRRAGTAGLSVLMSKRAITSERIGKSSVSIGRDRHDF
jgi:hypothetical protein